MVKKKIEKKIVLMPIYGRVDKDTKNNFDDELSKMKRKSGLSRDELISYAIDLLLKYGPPKKRVVLTE